MTIDLNDSRVYGEKTIPLQLRIYPTQLKMLEEICNAFERPPPKSDIVRALIVGLYQEMKSNEG